MRAIRKLGIVSAAAVALLVVGLLFMGTTPTSQALDPVLGIQNPGFEDGLDPWTVEEQADAAIVVGEEGPADFGTYADQGITVVPYEGGAMLRLGAPKEISEKQSSGPNVVSQTFTPDSDTLKFAFRLLSWEHRGYDLISFDLTHAGGAQIDPPPQVQFDPADTSSVSLPWNTAEPLTFGSCSSVPCAFTLDVGKRGRFLDSYWVKVDVTNIPEGEELTLTFSVAGTDNSAHATWAYFDSGNRPPVAKFEFLPYQPLEGDFVYFTNTSFDPDEPDDEIVSSVWTVQGPGIDQVVSSQDLIFVFPDEETYTVCLEVTDSYGASDSVCTGEIAVDGTPVPAAVISNADMRLNALNIEVLAGEDATLIGRFVDPGWTDTHTASFIVDGSPVTATVQEENDAGLSTGTVTGVFAAPATSGALAGTLTVYDEDGASASDDFVVTVLNAVDSRESNDAIASAPALESGWVYLSDIESADDVDVFGVVRTIGEDLPAGSEILVNLKELPADYDLVVLSVLPGSLQSAPWFGSPWFGSPWFGSPWFGSPWEYTPWFGSPWFGSPWFGSPWLGSPWFGSPWFGSPWLGSPWFGSPWFGSSLTFDQFALSQIGFASPEGNEIGGADIGLAELGLGIIRYDPGLSEDGVGPCNDTIDNDGDGAADSEDPDCLLDVGVVGYSANRGLEDEAVLVRTDYPGTEVYVAVVGNNGAMSTAPYALQIETSVPLDLTSFDQANCSGDPLVGSAAAGEVVHEYSGTPLSLFVTQPERLTALYGSEADPWPELLAELKVLADQGLVAGDIISLSSGSKDDGPPNVPYDDWDKNPCSVEAANNVAAAIRDEILTYLNSNPTIKYIVLVGNDDVIPYRRVPDETSISNEKLYLQDSLVLPGTPLFASLNGGNNLTDDYYVDLVPTPWQGRELYVPDWSVGRLVETPQEISAAAQAFVESEGLLDLSTAMVSGYDFFLDGSQLTADNLATKLATDDSLIRSDWTAAELRCRFLGEASGGLTDCAVNDVSVVNAHFTHYAALSASGFTLDDFNDFMSSEDVATAGGDPPALQGGILASIGCHAGLNVPDRAAVPPEAGLTIDPGLDFPQAMARQQAVIVASLGFGLGDDTGIAGTEQLVAIFAEELVKGGTAGQALVNAKQSYLLGLSAMTVYEEKSVIQTALHGLPQYQLQVPAGLAAAAIQAMQAEQSGVNLATLLLTIEDPDAEVPTTTTTTHLLKKVATDDGDYITASPADGASDGDFQGIPGRPVQPRVVKELAQSDPVHGVLLTAGEFTGVEPWNPVISTPAIEWNPDPEELQICVPSFWPSLLATVKSLETAEGLSQNLLVTPGQFRCTSGSDPEVTGIERYPTAATFQVRRSASDDFEPPLVGSVDLSTFNESGVAVTVDAVDDSGIAEVIVLVIGDGTITSVHSGPLPATGPFTIEVPDAADAELIVQVVDGAGNVAAWTAKGVNLKLIPVDAGPNQVLPPAEPEAPVQLPTTIYGFTGLTQPVFFTWDFGDGAVDSGVLAPDDVVIDPDGNALFTVEHGYSEPTAWPVTATLKVTDAAGGIGVDKIEFLPRCDPTGDVVNPDADLVGCWMENDATTMEIVLLVEGLISNDLQYRVKVDSVPGGVTHLRYDGGQVTGTQGLQAQVDRTELRFIFDLADIGLTAGDDVLWFGETQAGVPGAPQVGIDDRAPDDDGWLPYVVH